MLHYLADEPIYPIGYVQQKFARCNSNQAHDEVIDELPIKLLRQPFFGRSIEYADNCLTLYAAQETFQKYLQACNPNLQKLNVLRKKVGNFTLSAD